jgi:cation diffusion facilitator CzcD-associated flavoprotein CzcO
VHRFIKFEHRVVSAIWNDEKAQYMLQIERADGTILRDQCDVLVNAAGILK